MALENVTDERYETLVSVDVKSKDASLLFGVDVVRVISSNNTEYWITYHHLKTGEVLDEYKFSK